MINTRTAFFVRRMGAAEIYNYYPSNDPSPILGPSICSRNRRSESYAC